MTGVGVLSLFAGALQLTVPSYGLRLVRRFGTQRIGWFLVLAFLSLALLHLLGPPRSIGSRTGPGIYLELFCAAGSVLLLFGMLHMDKLYTEREQARAKFEQLRRDLETTVREKTAWLNRSNQELLHEIALLQHTVNNLKASDAQHRLLFEENPQAEWIFDLHSGNFLAANKAMLQLYGFAPEDFTALTAQSLVPEENVEAFLQDSSNPAPEPVTRGVWEHYRRDGTRIFVELAVVDVEYGGTTARLVAATDVTRRRHRELELRDAQKAQVTAEMAAGVATHFTPLFNGIEGRAVLLLRDSPAARMTEQLNQIAEGAVRGAELTGQLLALAGRQPMRLEPIDINAVLQARAQMLRRMAGPAIDFQDRYGNYVPPVMADRQAIERILDGLVLNARDAMTGGGTLLVTTGAIRLDRSPDDNDQDARVGEFVRLAVQDTGCGMAPDVQACLFEPFFTTREPGKSCGLGLASIRGLVKQLGGWMEFTSEPGAGTEFRVFLPSAPAAVIRSAAPAPAAEPVRTTILLVEPEERVRTLARAILNHRGFRVVEADSSAIALILWDSQAAQVELLVTALALPGGLSGPDLARQLRQSKPMLRVVYTGEPTGDEQEQASRDGAGFLGKPYTPDALFKAVQSCIET